MRGNPEHFAPKFVELDIKVKTPRGGYVWRQPRLLGELLSQLLELREESHCSQGAGFKALSACAQLLGGCARSGANVPRGCCPGSMNGAPFTSRSHCSGRCVAMENNLEIEEALIPTRTANQDARMSMLAICTPDRGSCPLSHPSHSIPGPTFAEGNWQDKCVLYPIVL